MRKEQPKSDSVHLTSATGQGRTTEARPVAWRFKSREGGEWHFDGTEPTGHVFNVEPLYATPSPAAQGWMPIETAPRDGTEILVWREDCGPFMAKWTCANDLRTMSDRERDELDEESLFSYDWFGGDSEGNFRADGSEVPTHWMPLPADPDATPSPAPAALTDDRLNELAVDADLLVSLGDGRYGPLPAQVENVRAFARAVIAAQGGAEGARAARGCAARHEDRRPHRLRAGW